MKRRKFLTILGATATLVVVGSFSLPILKPSVKILLRNWSNSLVKIPEASVGSLQPETIRTLMAATEALLQEQRIEKTHYEQFFRWHAEKLSGYKAIYEKFAVAVNHISQKEHDCAFIGATPAIQRQILERVAMVNPARFLPSKVDKLRLTLLERDRFCFQTFILSEVFRLFARTDALILAGFESWRTQPRGLKNYTLPPDTVKPAANLLN